MRPRGSSPKELRDSDNAESPPITELNAIFPKDPELPLLSSCARTEFVAAGGGAGLLRPDPLSEDAWLSGS